MISTGDLKKGVAIELDGELWQILDYHHIKMGRGSAQVRITLRNIKRGQTVERSFQAGTKWPRASMEKRPVQFLYRDGDGSHFMDRESYEQFTLGDDVLGETAPWLNDQLELSGTFFNGNAVGVALPTFVEAEIDMVGGGSKGDTASGKNLKDATLTNGETLKVPLFIESGEKVLVDTRTWEFARRAKG